MPHHLKQTKGRHSPPIPAQSVLKKSVPTYLSLSTVCNRYRTFYHWLVCKNPVDWHSTHRTPRQLKLARYCRHYLARSYFSVRRSWVLTINNFNCYLYFPSKNLPVPSTHLNSLETKYPHTAQYTISNWIRQCQWIILEVWARTLTRIITRCPCLCTAKCLDLEEALDP